VTFQDGHSQAFLLEDVDLEASGLAPVTSERPGNPGPTSIADARGSADSSSRVTLTDADVNHVRPALRTAPPEDEGDPADEGPQPAALLVSDLSQQIAGGVLTLSGRVRNSGGQPVTSVALQAQAVDGQGNVAGSGSTVIPDDIGPGQVVSFTIDFPVSGRVTDVKVSARAAMVDFNFEPVTRQEAEGSQE